MSRLHTHVKINGATCQLIRYGVVGAGTNIAAYLVYLVITHLGVGPKQAMTLVYIVGASLGFIGNHKWTFAHKSTPLRAAVRYITAHLLGYLLNFLIMFIFVDRLGYAHAWVQAVAIIAVAGFLFIVFKYFVFFAKGNRFPEL